MSWTMRHLSTWETVGGAWGTSYATFLQRPLKALRQKRNLHSDSRVNLGSLWQRLDLQRHNALWCKQRTATPCGTRRNWRCALMSRDDDFRMASVSGPLLSVASAPPHNLTSHWSLSNLSRAQPPIHTKRIHAYPHQGHSAPKMGITPGKGKVLHITGIANGFVS